MRLITAVLLSLFATSAVAGPVTMTYDNNRAVGPANPSVIVSGNTAAMTGTTSTLLLAAPAAGQRNYVTGLICGNSHATVGTFVAVQDGSGGTTLYTLPAAAVYGGAVAPFSFAVPLRQPTTATGIYVADVTTGANVICSAVGFTAP